MIVKENFYLSPIYNLSLIDNLFFHTKLILFTVASALLIFLSLLFGKIIPPIEKWSPVFFHKILLWLLSIEVEIVCETKRSRKGN